MAQQRQLLGHVKGDKGDPGKDGTPGKDGRDAVILAGTVTVDGTTGDPSGTITMGGEPGAQTISIALSGIKGEPGPPGPSGEAAVVSKEAPGIVPPLPEDASETKAYALGWGADGPVWVEGGSALPNPRELKALIAEATAKRDAAKAKESGDYEFGTVVTTRDALDTFGAAIDAAQAIADEYYSQAELDEARRTLQAAVDAFDRTCTELAADKSGFTAQESRLSGLKAGATLSEDGKELDTGTKWYRAEDQETADAALEVARGAVESATRQSEIDAAVATLTSAVDAFEESIQTAGLDYGNLDAAIRAANAAKQDVETSDQEGADLEPGSRYVTTEQMGTFDAAIQAATSARSTATKQEQLDAATSTLTEATSTFEGQVRQNVSIYGVRFDGFPTTTKGTRTDAAADFGDVKPAVSNGSGSSPFDAIEPWASMVPEDRTGGRMVKIPKFYYKLEQNGTGVNIQIATGQMDGFSVSPAHMDRHDGKGEREAVYVGRYHCATETYKSTTGVMPANNADKATMYGNCHNVGGDYYMMDFATRFTLWLLYLVETAEWNSQNLIGFGCGNNSAPENMGYTDDMSYCTGTTQADTATKAIGTQYRNIEGLWDNVYDFMSGCYNDASGLNIITDTANLGDSTGGKLVGLPQNGWCAGLTVSEDGGFPMFYNSDTTGGGESVGTCDCWSFVGSSPVVFVGGYYNQNVVRGMFYVNYTSATNSGANCGCRLLELP